MTVAPRGSASWGLLTAVSIAVVALLLLPLATFWSRWPRWLVAARTCCSGS